MPLYFAYGSNMDVAVMARQCPGATVIAPARLMGHRVFIHVSGRASVRRSPTATVYGLLWDVPLADVPALDRSEDVVGGSFTKIIQPVVKPQGTARALIYVARSLAEGTASAAYLDAMIAAAKTGGLPTPYVTGLVSLLPRASARPREGGSSPDTGMLRSGPMAGVRPRFATPFDRD
ncbi:gamma-glutamylcyclotransferase family protein [Lichenihabitans psoromatis]|uniref:gamma-glutamylcyclotransferase family protein n=1 Tax=Lichenihabitans psoromatis TaxID=2528642 RepID=UPI001036B05F|nr:gamma-glutamylcyclotransferase family protein [Lichenihabitans psoromatis]